jgi:DNA polymerase-3 subunit beta
MEFSVQRAAFLRELSLSQGVVERKKTIPILSNVLLDVSEDSVQITATDLELGIRTSCTAKVKKGGSTTVPAKKLLEYVRQLGDGEIRFKLSGGSGGGSLRVASGRSNVRMAGMAKDTFPILPEFSGKMTVLPPRVLNQLIQRTIFAISSEESRYTINAALLILKPETMTMVSTDGHRLAHIETDESITEQGYAGVSGELKVLIPKKAMTELIKILGEVPEGSMVEFNKDDNHLFFRMGSRILISRLLSGQFPNYEAVLPKGNDKVVVLDTAEVAAAVRRVSLFSDDRSRSIRFQLEPGEVKLVATGSEVGESEESLPAEYDGAAFTIGFNYQYLLDFFAASDAEKVSFEFKDEQTAGQICPLGDDKMNYRYLVMPMRV